jgi:hypothetical protein
MRFLKKARQKEFFGKKLGKKSFFKKRPQKNLMLLEGLSFWRAFLKSAFGVFFF